MPSKSVTYTSDSGTVLSSDPVLSAGTHTLTVSFTPTDTTDYTTATKTVSIDVLQATPIISWAPPPITAGTALSNTQLNAAASASWTVAGVGVNVPGNFNFTPGAGTVLSAGSHTFTLSFTPNDATNYTIATITKTIDVLPTTPIIPTKPHPTKTTVAAKPKSSNVGQPVILTVTVKNRDRTGGAPIGDVSLLDGTTMLGSPTLINGKASLRISGLLPGRHPIRVYFEGAGDFIQSTSAVLIETVHAHRSKTKVSASQSIRGSGLVRVLGNSGNL